MEVLMELAVLVVVVMVVVVVVVAAAGRVAARGSRISTLHHNSFPPSFHVLLSPSPGHQSLLSTLYA
ncbi:hypothetical protein E2C01_040928 [Portunus trituberculatus]|uniref:Uncharacterized protein n=1 Tax=Portunus trituberculatus TaxID=210409 RepID=A0A5B7FIP6_PORTR|nr:hypothetical protein [Portunus trituberculatus]